MIITTTDSEELAQKISTGLVTSKLAACVQIDSINSVYSWDGAIHNSKEYRLMIKTVNSLYSQVEDFIKKNHSYDTPEIIRIKIDTGLDSYLNWINSYLTI